MCDTTNALRDVALGAIGLIPEVGGLLAGITKALWPASSGESVGQLLNEIVDYVDAKVADAVSTVLLSDINTDWIAMAQEADQLQLLMDTNDTSTQAVTERTSRLNNIISRCTSLLVRMNDESIQSVQLLAFVSPVG
eukprot:405954_1